MKKQKLIFKVDNSYRGKIYVNGKWIKNVTSVDIKAKPQDYQVVIEKYKTNEFGLPYAVGNELASETLSYRIKRGGR